MMRIVLPTDVVTLIQRYNETEYKPGLSETVALAEIGRRVVEVANGRRTRRRRKR